MHATSQTHENTDKHPRDSKGRADEDIYLALSRGYTTYRRHKQTHTPSVRLCECLSIHLFSCPFCLKSKGNAKTSSHHKSAMKGENMKKKQQANP